MQHLCCGRCTATAWPSPRGNAFIGGTDRAPAAGSTSPSGATFTKGVYIPELASSRPGAFACITCALIVGVFAERVKFAA